MYKVEVELSTSNSYDVFASERLEAFTLVFVLKAVIPQRETYLDTEDDATNTRDIEDLMSPWPRPLTTAVHIDDLVLAGYLCLANSMLALPQSSWWLRQLYT